MSGDTFDGWWYRYTAALSGAAHELEFYGGKR